MAVAKFPPELSSAPPHAGTAAVIPHWIGGRPVAGGGPRLPVFNPATGAIAREVALATTADVEAAVASARAALPAWAEMPPMRRARVLSALSRAAERAARCPRRPHHRRARQGVQRRAGRGDARHRDRRIRLRHPAAAEGRLHRPGLHRHRQLDAAPAARRRGRHHAVQLSLHGAVLDVPAGDRVRQHLRAEAERARSVRCRAHGARC